MIKIMYPYIIILTFFFPILLSVFFFAKSTTTLTCKHEYIICIGIGIPVCNNVTFLDANIVNAYI
jgi:hypothetical protein